MGLIMNKKTASTVANKKTTVANETLYRFDEETGEMIALPATIIVEEYNEAVDVGWDKIWLGEVLQALEQVGNKKLKVASYIINNRDKRTNYLLQTQEEMAVACSVSKPTVNQTMQALEKAGLISYKAGIYQVNPNGIMNGGHNHRMAILRIWEKNKNDKQSKKKAKIDENQISEVSNEQITGAYPTIPTSQPCRVSV